VSQVAKVTYRSQGQWSLPMVIRIPFGGGIGAVEHHAESPESFFCHIAGLRVMACSCAHDAYWMIQEAIACPDPVVFFEPKRRYWEKGPLDTASRPSTSVTSVVRRAGTDCTVVSYGPSMPVLYAAADAAAAEGRSLEIIDLRSLSPLDLGPVLESVRRTGRLVVVSEAPRESSITSEIAARVTEEAFYSLAAPVLRVAGYDTRIPPAGSRRCICPIWTRCSTPSTAPWRTRRPADESGHHRHPYCHVPAPGRRRGADRGRDPHLARRRGG
jgi:pyruvate dehydrogenase E1 component beta subunit